MKNKKRMALGLVLLMVLTLCLAGCGTAKTEDTASTDPMTVHADGEVIGEGKTSFPLTIVDADGKEVKLTINTDEKYVGTALESLGLIEGEEGEYGLYVEKVNGKVLDYDADQMYWAFYIGDTYASTGIEKTDITPDTVYMLKADKAEL